MLKNPAPLLNAHIFKPARAIGHKHQLPLAAGLGIFLVTDMLLNFILGTIYRPELISFGHTVWASGTTWLWLLFGMIIVAAYVVGALVKAFAWSVAAVAALAVWALVAYVVIELLGADPFAYGGMEHDEALPANAAPVTPAAPPAMPEASIALVTLQEPRAPLIFQGGGMRAGKLHGEPQPPQPEPTTFQGVDPSPAGLVSPEDHLPSHDGDGQPVETTHHEATEESVASTPAAPESAASAEEYDAPPAIKLAS